MSELSILYHNPSDTRITDTCEAPASLVDLNLDQVFEKLSKQKPDYKLERILFQPLADIHEARYRQDVFRDLLNTELETSFLTYSESMRSVERTLESLEKIVSSYHKKGWFLEAVLQYCSACALLDQALSKSEIQSSALVKLRSHLKTYLASQSYTELVTQASLIKNELETIDFTVTVKNLTITVRKYEGEKDYGKALENTFIRFSQGECKNYLVPYSRTAGVNHIQAQVLEGVAKLWPDTFDKLDAFCEKSSAFVNPTLQCFAQDIQFFLVWLDLMHELETKGYSFNLPELLEGHRGSHADELFDIALAIKQEAKIVCNDFSLEGDEHIIVVTGPNQGGKTTFARALGQMHYLAALGCPVQGSKAAILMTDRIFTHFEREESFATHHGKLYEELLDMHDCLEKTTERSLLILNEAFSSTTVHDSLMLSERVMKKIIELRPFSIWVTFLSELSDMHPSIVSMTGGIVPEEPALRTFRIVRKKADDLAYARALAEKHGLLYKQLQTRLQK